MMAVLIVVLIVVPIVVPIVVLMVGADGDGGGSARALVSQ